MLALRQHLIDEFSVQEWYENFRLSRATFKFLVEELNPELEIQDTKMRKAVKVENKVTLFLNFIVSTASYSTLCNLFGLSRGFVCISIRNRNYLFISASEDSRRLKHTVSIDISNFVFLENFGVAPVMYLDLFLSELLSSGTKSLPFSEFSSELLSEVPVSRQKDNYDSE